MRNDYVNIFINLSKIEVNGKRQMASRFRVNSTVATQEGKKIKWFCHQKLNYTIWEKEVSLDK